MKNEQQNNQDQGRQNTRNSGNQQQQTGTSGTESSQQKSNISVDNEGRIGKAHDQWNNNNNNRNEQDQRNNSDSQSNQLRSDKTVTDPEIDAPIYDPEKTEKKIPRMEEQRKPNK